MHDNSRSSKRPWIHTDEHGCKTNCFFHPNGWGPYGNDPGRRIQGSEHTRNRFLEKVYENALALELSKSGLFVERQKKFPVRYEGTAVGDYQADLVVARKVIVECKATSNLDPAHEAQLINYLKASGLRVGLLLNFGRAKLQYRRMVA